jgi:ABC-type multidrug transport system fused ATPase/permease subunit
MLRPYGRIYRPWLVKGTLATVGLVLLRLALPWPLKGVIEVLMPHHHPKHTHLAWVPSFGDPILWFVGGFVLLVLLVGIAEMLQRICMAKFATHTVHDLRAAAVRGAARRGGQEDPGELIARIIGDAARIKESLKGILIHASQNGLFFLGVAVVFVLISPKLSAYFFVGGVIAIAIGGYTSSRVATVFRKQRKKEGAYASALYQGLENDSLDLDRLNQSSATKDVRITKLMTVSSLVVHVALAATTGIAVWVGSGQVRAGTLSAGDLFLFITYALAVHHRVVQVGRQLSRSGKVMACVDRIGSLIDDSAPAVPVARPLAESFRLDAAGLGQDEGRTRIGPLDLVLKAGSRVAVLGDTGSGKSSLLRLLAGVESPDRGRIRWDDEDLSERSADLMARVGYLGQETAFTRARIWRILGLAGPEAPPADMLDLLKRIGAWPILERLPRGLKEKVGSADFSRNEARLLRLAAILLGNAPVWLMDGPFDGLPVRRARRCLDVLLDKLGSRTLVVALARPVSLERFDRVVVLRDGRVRFDGTPQEWNGRKVLKNG